MELFQYLSASHYNCIYVISYWKIKTAPNNLPSTSNLSHFCVWGWFRDSLGIDTMTKKLARPISAFRLKMPRLISSNTNTSIDHVCISYDTPQLLYCKHYIIHKNKKLMYYQMHLYHTKLHTCEVQNSNITIISHTTLQRPHSSLTQIALISNNTN